MKYLTSQYGGSVALHLICQLSPVMSPIIDSSSICFIPSMSKSYYLWSYKLVFLMPYIIFCFIILGIASENCSSINSFRCSSLNKLLMYPVDILNLCLCLAILVSFSDIMPRFTYTSYFFNFCMYVKRVIFSVVFFDYQTQFSASFILFIF